MDWHPNLLGREVDGCWRGSSVKHGADPTLKPSNGIPALLWAAGVSQHRAENVVPEDDLLAAVKVAVEHGADINSTDPGNC